MHRAFQVASQFLYRPSRPVRSGAYKQFIRSHSCIACGSTRFVEAAHFGPHGIGQKSSDLQTLPLCQTCHRTGPHSYHLLGPAHFAEFYRLDISGTILHFQLAWETLQLRPVVPARISYASVIESLQRAEGILRSALDRGGNDV